VHIKYKNTKLSLINFLNFFIFKGNINTIHLEDKKIKLFWINLVTSNEFYEIYYIIFHLFFVERKQNYCEFSMPIIFFLLNFDIKQQIIKSCISHLQMGKDGLFEIVIS
jgi:hypothetical protein